MASNMYSEQERAESVLDDLLACQSGMSGKELGFIEDMDKKRGLPTWTEKQIEWLDLIYERVC